MTLMVHAPDVTSLPAPPDAPALRPQAAAVANPASAQAQAMALLGSSVMQQLLAWGEAARGNDDDAMGLRQRLEMTALAIQTGAPLTTREAGLLLGAKPTASPMRRAGLVASRVGRNAWQLRREGPAQEGADHGDHGADRDRVLSSNNFGSGLGRRS